MDKCCLGRLYPGAVVALCASSLFLVGGGNGHTLMTATATTTTTTAFLWSCASTRQLKIVAPDRKGMAIDDTTMGKCPDEIGIWPHSSQPLKSIRLFSGWKKAWGDKAKRDDAWKTLKIFLEAADAKVLVGVENGATHLPDEGSVRETLDLMKFVGKDRIMGVAFGNELDVKEHLPGDYFSPNGPLFQVVKKAVNEMDSAGFSDVPITTVWSQGVIANMNGNLKGYLRKALDTWGKRWIFSYNPYSIWDSSVFPQNAKYCQQMTDVAVGLEYVRNGAKAFRDNLNAFVGREDYKIWLTESGWSAPGVGIHSQRGVAKVCPQWVSQESLWSLYKNMMEWDLTLDGDSVNVDHLFYFSMRDSNGNWMEEHFGLVAKCGDAACKIDGSGTITATTATATNTTLGDSLNIVIAFV